MNEYERLLAVTHFRPFVNMAEKGLGCSKEKMPLNALAFSRKVFQPYTMYLMENHNANVLCVPLLEYWTPEEFYDKSFEEERGMPLPWDIAFVLLDPEEFDFNNSEELKNLFSYMKRSSTYQFVAVKALKEEWDELEEDAEPPLTLQDFDATWWGEKIAETLTIESIGVNRFGYFFSCL